MHLVLRSGCRIGIHVKAITNWLFAWCKFGSQGFKCKSRHFPRLWHSVTSASELFKGAAVGVGNAPGRDSLGQSRVLGYCHVRP